MRILQNNRITILGTLIGFMLFYLTSNGQDKQPKIGMNI